MRRSAAGLGIAAACLASANAGAETLRCKPIFATYCANIHVGCAGRSDAPTSAFTIRFDRDVADVERGGGGSWSGSFAASHSGRVARSGDGWIRIDPDLRFSERIRLGGRALMSAGACRIIEPDR